MLKQSDFKLGCAVVIALAIVGVMYGIDLLDTSQEVDSKCVYGLFRTITPPVIGLFIIVFCIWHKNTAPMADIHFHDWERYVFLVFFTVKLLVDVLNCIWFSEPDHPDGDCKVPAISMAAQITDGLFNLLQFICLFNRWGRNRLQRSVISYFLLLAMNCGLIWFDLSIEVQHLRHYTHDYIHLSSQYIFLITQAVYWIGLEFHITIVELLVMGCLKPHE
jgi:hypothetical protein